MFGGNPLTWTFTVPPALPGKDVAVTVKVLLVLPAGTGGSPGGETFALKLAFADRNVKSEKSVGPPCTNALITNRPAGEVMGLPPNPMKLDGIVNVPENEPPAATVVEASIVGSSAILICTVFPANVDGTIPLKLTDVPVGPAVGFSDRTPNAPLPEPWNEVGGGMDICACANLKLFPPELPCMLIGKKPNGVFEVVRNLTLTGELVVVPTGGGFIVLMPLSNNAVTPCGRP